jgi:hypothetical protein
MSSLEKDREVLRKRGTLILVLWFTPPDQSFTTSPLLCRKHEREIAAKKEQERKDKDAARAQAYTREYEEEKARSAGAAGRRQVCTENCNLLLQENASKIRYDFIVTSQLLQFFQLSYKHFLDGHFISRWCLFTLIWSYRYS